MQQIRDVQTHKLAICQRILDHGRHREQDCVTVRGHSDQKIKPLAIELTSADLRGHSDIRILFDRGFGKIGCHAWKISKFRHFQFQAGRQRMAGPGKIADGSFSQRLNRNRHFSLRCAPIRDEEIQFAAQQPNNQPLHRQDMCLHGDGLVWLPQRR